MWLLREFKHVVEVGSRAISLYMVAAPSEHSRGLGKHILHLMVDAQEQLVAQAEAFLQQQTDNLDAFVRDWEEAQAKKRKKKLRIARLEKSDEELAYEADKGVLQMKMYTASSVLDGRNARLKELRDLKKRFEASYSMGWSLISKVLYCARRTGPPVHAFTPPQLLRCPDACLSMYMQVTLATQALLADCQKEIQALSERGSFPEAPPDYRDCLQNKELVVSVEGVLGQYEALGNFLREKGERLGIVEALDRYVKDSCRLLVVPLAHAGSLRAGTATCSCCLDASPRPAGCGTTPSTASSASWTRAKTGARSRTRSSTAAAPTATRVRAAWCKAACCRCAPI